MTYKRIDSRVEELEEEHGVADDGDEGFSRSGGIDHVSAEDLFAADESEDDEDVIEDATTRSVHFYEDADGDEQRTITQRGEDAGGEPPEPPEADA